MERIGKRSRMSNEDNVVDLPMQDPMKDLPQATRDSLSDPGWIAAAILVSEIGTQVFGGSAAINAIPDPEGWHQEQAGKEEGRPGVFVEVSSIAVPGLAASMVVPFEVEAFGDIRRVFAEMLVQLRHAESRKMAEAAGPSLLIPEKKLLLLGRD
jgi:hypothetical protein